MVLYYQEDSCEEFERYNRRRWKLATPSLGAPVGDPEEGFIYWDFLRDRLKGAHQTDFPLLT
jgi:hypothetical protein